MKKNKRIKTTLEEANKIACCLSALANEKRVRIMLFIKGKEMSVGDVARVLEMPQSSVSLHFEKLYNSGWVERKREGKNVYYKINSKNVEEFIKLLNHSFIYKKNL